MTPARRFRVAAIALLAGLGAVNPSVAEDEDDRILEPGPAHAAAHVPDAEALVARIAALAENGDVGALVEVAREALLSNTLPNPARERVLYESARAFAAVDATTESEALLDELAAHRPTVQVWLYDGPHRIAVPLYEVAAAARHASQHQQEARVQQATTAAIALAGDDALTAFAAAAPPMRRGVLLAFEHAPVEQLLAYRDRASLAAENGCPIEIAEVIARRLADAPLMERVLAQADPALALAIVRRARASYSDADAYELLAAAADREDVGSAALLELAGLMGTDARVRRALFDTLGDPRLGGSAAAALAAAHDPEIATALRSWVLEQGDDAVARRGILALRLDASDAARAALARLAADASLSDALRAQAAR